MRKGTYSIVARDPATGALGVAVQSHWFSVGSVVSWARPGIGAVATQSIAEIAYGPDLLDLLAEGHSPVTALGRRTKADPNSQVRQVAVVGAKGEVAVHTGAGCIPHAGHERGEGFCCQANMMAGDGVPKAMREAFEGNAGDPLPERLLKALHAAEAAGGDVRGRQSAALLVVSGEPDPPWRRLVDLRVEDHDEPLEELERVLVLHRAYELASEGDDLVAEGRNAEAGERYEAAARLAPGNQELRFWAGLAAYDRGDHAAGIALLDEVIAEHAGWRGLLERLPEHIAPNARQALSAVRASSSGTA